MPSFCLQVLRNAESRFLVDIHCSELSRVNHVDSPSRDAAQRGGQRGVANGASGAPNPPAAAAQSHAIVFTTARQSLEASRSAAPDRAACAPPAPKAAPAPATGLLAHFGGAIRSATSASPPYAEKRPPQARIDDGRPARRRMEAHDVAPRMEGALPLRQPPQGVRGSASAAPAAPTIRRGVARGRARLGRPAASRLARGGGSSLRRKFVPPRPLNGARAAAAHGTGGSQDPRSGPQPGPPS